MESSAIGLDFIGHLGSTVLMTDGSGRLWLGPNFVFSVERKMGKVMRNRSIAALIFIAIAAAGFAAQPGPSGARHRVVSGLMPAHPPLALQAGIEGSVTFELSVEGGRVKQISKAAGNPLLVGPSKQIASSWQFSQTTKAHVAVQFRYTIGKAGEPGTARCALEYLPSGGVRVDVLGYRPPPVVLY